MSAITTCAPSSANRRAVARPMPEEPPVITAVLESRRPGMGWLPVRCGGSVVCVEDVLDVSVQPVRSVGSVVCVEDVLDVSVQPVRSVGSVVCVEDVLD